MRYQRALGYLRVSGREQAAHGTSLEAQRAAITGYAGSLGIPLTTWHEVESASAEKLNDRRELAALLREAKPGDLILVTMVDRWSRDIPHAVASVRELVARGVGWIAILDGIDASTSAGRAALDYRALGADHERQRIRERTVGRRDELSAMGHWIHPKIPFGYLRGPRGSRSLLAHPTNATIIAQLFERALGASLPELIAWLEIETGRVWDKKAVHSLLRHRLYRGEVRGPDGWAPSEHVARLVTQELYERVQEALRSRRSPGATPRTRTALWLLRGLASCPRCGARMSASFGREPYPWGWYACARHIRLHSCPGPWVRVLGAEQRAAELTVGRLLELREELSREQVSAPRAADRNFASERARLDGDIARAVALATAGDITTVELRAQRTRIASALGRIDAAEVAQLRAEATNECPGGKWEDGVSLVKFPRSWRKKGESKWQPCPQCDGEGFCSAETNAAAEEERTHGGDPRLRLVYSANDWPGKDL